MARARNIKPGLFKNEILGEADPILTILFMGLWCLADREGRLEDRPRRIQAEIFPYRDLPLFNGYLTELQQLGFIDRYEVGNQAIIQVVNFTKHQAPHKTEKHSELPAKPVTARVTCNAPLNNGCLTVKESLIPDSLIPDSGFLIPDSRKKQTTLVAVATRDVELVGFDDFYSAYPKKVGRDDALKAWKKLKPDTSLINQILEDIRRRVEMGAWCTGSGKAFIPGPGPYLNQKKWLDEIIPRPEFRAPQDFSRIAREAQEI